MWCPHQYLHFSLSRCSSAITDPWPAYPVTALAGQGSRARKVMAGDTLQREGRGDSTFLTWIEEVTVGELLTGTQHTVSLQTFS